MRLSAGLSELTPQWPVVSVGGMRTTKLTRPRPAKSIGDAPRGPTQLTSEEHRPPAGSDPRFEPYCEIYKNLDTLKWQNLATLLAITVFGMNAVISVEKEPASLILGISNHSTAGLLLLVQSLLYAVVLFSMARIRGHLEIMNDHLAELDPKGYFAQRRSGRRPWLSGSAWSMLLFCLIACLCVVAAIIELNRGGWLYR